VACLKIGVAPFQAMHQRKVLSWKARGLSQLSRTEKRRISTFCRPREHLRFRHPKGRGQSHQSDTTTSAWGVFWESRPQCRSGNSLQGKWSEWFFLGGGRNKIRDSLGTWFSCDEQKDRQENLFFSLAYFGLLANLSKKLSIWMRPTSHRLVIVVQSLSLYHREVGRNGKKNYSSPQS